MSDSVTGEILAAFSIICLVAWWNDWPPIANNEVTTYNVQCQSCKPDEVILYRKVYRAEPASHTVTTWTKEGGYISIYRDCAIQDKDNWRCDTRDPESKWNPRFSDGVFAENTLFPVAEQIPWYKWWWLRLIEASRKK